MIKLARAWVSIHQALRAVESVNRFWAKSLGLNPEDVLLLLILAHEEHTPTSLGSATGRQRQQVHRSLLRFEREHLAQACAFARQGRATHWRLTPHGKRMVGCLERRMQIWEAELNGRVNVDTLCDELRGLMETLLNRRFGNYFSGLYVPTELRKDPNLEFVREAEMLREEHERLARTPPPREEREELARQHAEAVREADEEASRETWRRLWR